MSWASSAGSSVGSLVSFADADADAKGSYNGFSISFERSDSESAVESDAYNFKDVDGLSAKDGKLLWNGEEVGAYDLKDGVFTVRFTSDAVTAAVAEKIVHAVRFTTADMSKTIDLTVKVSDGLKESSAKLTVMESNVVIDDSNAAAGSVTLDKPIEIIPEIGVTISEGVKVDSLQVTVSSSDAHAEYALKDGSGYTFADGKIYKAGTTKAAADADAGTLIGTYTVKNGALVITMADKAVQGDVQNILQNLTYKSADQAPLDGSVTFGIKVETVSDGAANTLVELKDAVSFYVNKIPAWNGGENYAIDVFPDKDVAITLPKDLFKDPEGTELTYEVENLPAGLTFDAKTMTISGKAPATQQDVVIKIKVVDADGGAAEKEVTLKVTDSANLAPTVSPDAVVQNLTTEAGKPFTQDVTSLFTDPNGDKLTYSVDQSTLPEGMTFENGVLSGTPTKSGSFTIKVTASDGRLSTSADITFNVTNDVPVLNDGAALPDLKGGEDVSINLSSFFRDPEGTKMTFVVEGLPDGLQYADGYITGRPTASKAYSITIKAVDAYGGESAAWKATLNVLNEAPQYNSSSYPDYSINAGEQNFAVKGGLKLPDDLFTDDFGVAKWAITGVAQDGTAVKGGLESLGLTFDSTSHTFSGTPKIAGTFEITVTVTDANGETAAHEVKLVIGANKVPVVTEAAKNPVFVFGAQGSQSLADWIKDPSGETLTYELTGDLPSGLTYNASTNTISGTAEVTGDFKLTLKASDGTNDPVSYEFTLTVRGNSVPVVNESAGMPHIVGGANISLKLDQYFKDADGDALSFEVKDLPAGLSYDADNHTIYGTTTEVGTHVVTIKVSDPYGLSQTYEIPVTVRGNTAPHASGAPVVYGDVGGGFRADLHDFFQDPEGDAFKLEVLTKLPDGFTFNADTGIVSGNSNVEGAVAVEVRATDVNGLSTTRTVVLAMRIPNVNLADAGVVNAPFGEGLEILRDQDPVRDIEAYSVKPTELAVDRPVDAPVFGAARETFYAVGTEPGEMSVPEKLLALYAESVDQKEGGDETADRTLQRRIERAVERLEKDEASAETTVEKVSAKEAAQAPESVDLNAVAEQGLAALFDLDLKEAANAASEVKDVAAKDGLSVQIEAHAVRRGTIFPDAAS